MVQIDKPNFSRSYPLWLTGICLVLASCNANQQRKEPEAAPVVIEADPLPSWNEGPTKQAVIDYVKDVTNSQSQNFIAVPERIATFDNDGTLWSEQPLYFQFIFAIERVRAMAANHPEWKNKQPFKAVLENNMPELMKQGEKGLFQIVIATHTGMTTDEFEKQVQDWVSTAQHPIKKKPYTELVFQPMLELIKYLQANEFKTFIVSGGEVEFMRPWAERVYNIPRDQVVGTSFKIKFEYNDGHPAIRRLPEIDLNNDKDGKPVGISRYIGRKPVFAAGNSDGDLQMMRWSDASPLKNFQLYVHHTDSAREWAYDRKSPIGMFNVGLDEANQKGWTLVDMAKDWKVIYPFEK